MLCLDIFTALAANNIRLEFIEEEEDEEGPSLLLPGQILIRSYHFPFDESTTRMKQASEWQPFYIYKHTVKSVIHSSGRS